MNTKTKSTSMTSAAVNPDHQSQLLIQAIRANNYEKVKRMLEEQNDLNINVRDKVTGNTPLHEAMALLILPTGPGDGAAMLSLLQNYAKTHQLVLDPHIENNLGKTPMKLVQDHKKKICVADPDKYLKIIHDNLDPEQRIKNIDSIISTLESGKDNIAAGLLSRTRGEKTTPDIPQATRFSQLDKKLSTLLAEYTTRKDTHKHSWFGKYNAGEKKTAATLMQTALLSPTPLEFLKTIQEPELSACKEGRLGKVFEELEVYAKQQNQIIGLKSERKVLQSHVDSKISVSASSAP